MTAPDRCVPPLQYRLVSLTPFEIQSQERLITFCPQISDGLHPDARFACANTRLQSSEMGRRERLMKLPVRRIIRNVPQWPRRRLVRRNANDIRRYGQRFSESVLPKTSEHSPTLHMAGKLKARRATYLVFTIFRKALIELSRVTICARPVQLSVTVMTGQENTRNSSNEEKRCPHVRSCHGTAWCWKNPIQAEYTCSIVSPRTTCMEPS